MTFEQMEKLYDTLSEYRKGEFSRSGYFRDKCMGTYIKYTIEKEYVINCNFFCTGHDEWELCISCDIASHYGFERLMDSLHFTNADDLAIPDTIDKLVAALSKMPPLIQTLKAKFKECLDEIAS